MLNLLTTSLQLFAIAPPDCRSTFFGMKAWYYYLNPKSFDDKCNIVKFDYLPDGNNGGDVPLVLLAVVDDLLRIAALVAVGFVIVGAVQMIISQGNPEDTSRAQSTIINALLGLAVAIVAAGFVAFLGAQLGN